MNQEKRTYSRIATNIQAWLRPLPTPDAPPSFHDASHILRNELPKGLAESRLPEGLIQFLLDIDLKLQTILGLLGREQLLADFPIKGTVTEISGAGVRLHCDGDAIPLGTPMEIVIALSQLPLRLAGAVGKAVRTDTDASSPYTVYGFEFTRIREDELDAVVGFVLQEERRRIRERKWD